MTNTIDSLKFSNINNYIKGSIKSNSSVKIKEFNNIDYKPKFIPLYFPQYYPIPQNESIYGKGFTEWDLMKKCKISRDGSTIRQPHSDIGYYNPLDYMYWEFLEKTVNNYNIYSNFITLILFKKI